MKRRAVFWAVLVLTQTACYDPDAYNLSPSRINELLSVTTSAPAVPANGVAKITITVQIDPQTDLDKRLVTISTSGGTLVWGSEEGSATTLLVDDTGRVVVDLRSGTVAGPVRLDVRVGPLSRNVTVQFTAVRREELYGVDVSRTTLPADGFSTSRITVTLRQFGTARQRVVVFQTSGGTLVGPGLVNAREASVTADTSGVAIVDLQSDKTAGPVRVSITAFDRTEEIDFTFAPADPSQVITVSANPGAVAADGASTIAIAASVSPSLPAGRRSVTFRTTLGQFLPGRIGEFTIEADGSNRALATLVGSTTGGARVTATVDGTTAETTVQFTTALPDTVFVSAAAAALRSGESTLVTVTLLRNVGEVSPRLQVDYSAVTNTGTPIGSFSGVTLGSNSVSTATFNVGPTAFLGSVTVRASVAGGAAGAASVQIVP